MKNQYNRGELPKKRAWTVCRFKGLDKKERGVFESSWYPSAHYDGVGRRKATTFCTKIFLTTMKSKINMNCYSIIQYKSHMPNNIIIKRLLNDDFIQIFKDT